MPLEAKESELLLCYGASRAESLKCRRPLDTLCQVALKLRTPAGWLDGSAWVFVALALLTLVPAACVLWFMSDALTRESAASRQRVLEAYRSQLRLVRARLDPFWRSEAARLDRSDDPQQAFARLISAQAADGIVLLDAEGRVAYPDPSAPGNVGAGELERQLAALSSLDGTARETAIEAVTAMLNDYTTSLSARSRLALMERLRALSRNVPVPTEDALRLTMGMLETERPTPVSDVLRQTAVPEIWALAFHDRRSVAFYRTGRVESMMHDFLHQITAPGILFVAYPPGEPADGEAIAAGSWLPGWQVSFLVLQSPATEPRDRRMTAYLTVGLAGLTIITLIGIAALQSTHHQLRVARLKTDLVATASHELRTPMASMRVLVDGLLADRDLDPSKTREYLQMMAMENARLGRLIENFLTFSRLDRGRYRFTFAPVAPGALVRSAIEGIRDRLPAGSRLDTAIDASLPEVIVDEEAVSRRSSTCSTTRSNTHRTTSKSPCGPSATAKTLCSSASRTTVSASPHASSDVSSAASIASTSASPARPAA
jgi:signal transduction histidine kinase